MPTQKILLVEDDISLSSKVKRRLTAESYLVECCDSGSTALQKLDNENFDLIILDMILPDIDGLEVCFRYRASGGKGRILILSGRSGTEDKIAGLQNGADDYLAKPFDMRELSVRVSTLLRRSLELVSEKLKFEDIQLDAATHKTTRAGKDLKLGPQEFVLLEFFLRHPNRVISPEELVSTLWRGGGSIDTVRTHIKTLRRKLDSTGGKSLIKTIQGVGYSLTNDW